MDGVFLSGIGAGAGSSIFGFLTRSTLPEERAGVFAAVMACRQAGLLVGQFPDFALATKERCRSHLSAPCLCETSGSEEDFRAVFFDVQFDLRGAEDIQ